MNKKHSVYMTNVEHRRDFQIRWANYVEPFIHNGQALSNDSQMLTRVTYQKDFHGSAEFKPVMYLPTLTERIRQARNLFRSGDISNLAKVRIIMRSVSHMLLLLGSLTDRLLNKELLDDPDLGMFAATFQLYQQKKGQVNTLVPMDELFKSWKSLSRTKHFDYALYSLNEAFERKQVDEDLYDEYVAPLEEMRRVCYVNSKYNYRRDYLLTTAKETPLITRYFLDKEDPNTEAGKKVRAEILIFLAADAEKHRVHNRSDFHPSWVAQWAVNLLGEDFYEQPPPKDENLKLAWANKLLDMKHPKRILDNYKKSTRKANRLLDDLIEYSAWIQYKDFGVKKEEAYLSSLFNGEGFIGAVKYVASTFLGVGLLPRFFRIMAESADNSNNLLDHLLETNESIEEVDDKIGKETLLAIVSHNLNPDSMTPPEKYKPKENEYEKCAVCFKRTLFESNEIKLDPCPMNHRMCRPCLKSALYVTGSLGRCPCKTNGEQCHSLATRRDMEMVEVDPVQMYTIIERRVTIACPSWKNYQFANSSASIRSKSRIQISSVILEYHTVSLVFTRILSLLGTKIDVELEDDQIDEIKGRCKSSETEFIILSNTRKKPPFIFDVEVYTTSEESLKGFHQCLEEISDDLVEEFKYRKIAVRHEVSETEIKNTEDL